jgi:hypothetical protein
MRANERRERIFRHLSGGLVFAAPPEIKPRVRNAAPDLWSLRSLVLELDPTPARRSSIDDLDTEFDSAKTLRELPVEGPDPEFALEEAERREAHRRSEPRNVVSSLLRAVSGLLAEGRYREAVDVARRAVSLVEKQDSKDQFTYAALV